MTEDKFLPDTIKFQQLSSDKDKTKATERKMNKFLKFFEDEISLPYQ